MIQRGNHVLDVSKDTILQKGDALTCFGTYENINDLFKNLDKDRMIIEALTKATNEIALIDNYGKNAMCEVKLRHVPFFMEGKKMSENHIKERYKINVVMVKRNNESITVGRDTVIQEDDTLILFGEYNTIKQVFFGSVIYDARKKKSD